MVKIQGTIVQFGRKGYGFITGDDGKKYFVHQKNIYNGEKLKLNTRVKFAIELSDKGPIATEVEVLEQKQNLSNRTIIIMFFFLLVIQILTLYCIFFIK